MIGGVRVALVSGASAAALSLAEWIHNVAGVSGDVVIIGGAVGVTYSICRQLRHRVWLPTKAAWERIDHAADGVDELALNVNRRFDDVDRRLLASEERLAAFADLDAAMVREAVRRATEAPRHGDAPGPAA